MLTSWLTFSHLLLADAPPQATEADTRAAMVYQLARFVKWSDPSFDRPQQPFIIGVYSRKGVNAALRHIARGKKIRGRDIWIMDIASWKTGDPTPHVFYTDHYKTWKQVRGQLEHQPTLCIGSYKKSLEQGMDVTLYREKNHLAFGVNLSNLQMKETELPSQVLKLADPLIQEETP